MGEQGPQDNGSHESGGKVPGRGLGMAATALSFVAAVLAVIHRGSLFSHTTLLDISHLLLLAASIGWLVRAAIHGCIRYFCRTEVEGVAPYALAAISSLNAVFSIAWLTVSIQLLLERGNAGVTAAAASIACGVSFLLSLGTHRAAQKAKRPRASEWMRNKVRDPLEPGGTTPLGWLLIWLIDWRSSPHYLSTFVAGTSGTLLLILLLCGAAMVSEPSADAGAELGGGAEQKKGAGRQPGRAGDGAGEVGQALFQGTVGLHRQGLRKAIPLMCFAIHKASSVAQRPFPLPTEAFLCILMSDSGATNRAIILTPVEGS